jgi:hypothetical protein
MRRANTVLLVPVLACYVLDLILTLVGQPADYWSGYSHVDEVNGPMKWALSQHPALFVAMSLVYIAGCCCLVLILPPWFARRLSLLLTFTHTWGASSWLWLGSESRSPFVIFLLHLVMTLITAFSIERSIRAERQSSAE